MLFSKTEIEQATAFVHRHMSATPQYVWPQISNRSGTQVWIKHENHTPVGAFKIRGGLTFIDWLRRTHPDVSGIITATRGNHGQSQARAATHAGLGAKIYVPFGNSVEKNTAMKAFGADVVEFGSDFDEARIEATKVADEEGLFLVPAFHRELVRGVATYAYELLTAVPDLDTIYVPIGCGSGICGVISVRDALGLTTKIVGVVSDNAPVVVNSMAAGKPVTADRAVTFADGIATRVAFPEPFDIYSKGAERMVSVSDDEIAEAIRIYYHDTHNIAEGAGAAPLAALLKERDKLQGRKVAAILCGGNIDAPKFADILAGRTPLP